MTSLNQVPVYFHWGYITAVSAPAIAADCQEDVEKKPSALGVTEGEGHGRAI